jgi:hypothetical protein
VHVQRKSLQKERENFWRLFVQLILKWKKCWIYHHHATENGKDSSPLYKYLAFAIVYSITMISRA